LDLISYLNKQYLGILNFFLLRFLNLKLMVFGILKHNYFKYFPFTYKAI